LPQAKIAGVSVIDVVICNLPTPTAAAPIP